jgi:hypothetical protein
MRSNISFFAGPAWPISLTRKESSSSTASDVSDLICTPGFGSVRIEPLLKSTVRMTSMIADGPIVGTTRTVSEAP